MPELNFAYHDLGGRARGDRFTVDVSLFERQLDAMANARAPVTPTFDDGFESSLEIAAPALEQRGLSGAFFVITSGIGARRCLTADGIRELRARGHVIGSHTHNHPRDPYLKDLPDAQVLDEWRRSKAVLEDLLGEPVEAASLPYGFYTRRVAELAAQAGYRDLFISAPTVEPRQLGALTVHGRFGVITDTAPTRIAALCRLDRRALLREQAAWHARRTVKHALGPAYFRLRRGLLAHRHA